MKHLKALKTIVLLICLAVSFSGMQARKKEGTWRPKVGVVLSGGGVKGAAHVSILKAIEQAGIPIDYIVGTSMGSIVGGLYAMGYSTDQLDSLFPAAGLGFRFERSAFAPAAVVAGAGMA